jgi:Domain of unknown function (DUF5615)
MRFLVDMNLTPRWVPFLISTGHQATHWATVGAANAPDTVIFDYARRKNVILVLDWLAQPNQSAALMRFLIPRANHVKEYTPLAHDFRGTEIRELALADGQISRVRA